MIRVDANYIYQAAAQIRPLAGLTPDNRAAGPWFAALYAARAAIQPLVWGSVFGLRTCQASGSNLVTALDNLLVAYDDPQIWSEMLDVAKIAQLQHALSSFEVILAAELQMLPVYLATSKGGFDMHTLIGAGEVCFPEDLTSKVPEALPDVREATKCIAFELPTAAGFHLHRVNEAVLRRYYDAVTGGKMRPRKGSMGDYLNALGQHQVGDAKVKAALTELRDLHRNPLMHPEQSIDSVEAAIGLLGSVRTTVGYMLKEIPEPQNNLLASVLATFGHQPGN